MQPHDYWQTIHPPGSFDPASPHQDSYPASLPDGGQMLLPIRSLADGRHGIASLIINQASFDVLDALAASLAERLSPFRPDVIVGLPTLGLTLASAVAQKLGHTRYVPFGTSRKFWYLDELSVPMSSITTPHQQKRLFADPRMLPLLKGRRVVLVDDVMSSGTSMVAGLNLGGPRHRACGPGGRDAADRTLEVGAVRLRGRVAGEDAKRIRHAASGAELRRALGGDGLRRRISAVAATGFLAAFRTMRL